MLDHYIYISCSHFSFYRKQLRWEKRTVLLFCIVLLRDESTVVKGLVQEQFKQQLRVNNCRKIRKRKRILGWGKLGEGMLLKEFVLQVLLKDGERCLSCLVDR